VRHKTRIEQEMKKERLEKRRRKKSEHLEERRPPAIYKQNA